MIEAEHLTKSFSYHTKEAGLKNTFRDFFFRKKTERQVVKDVSFHIDDGEIVGFLGPNGAGKTTTIKMLSGILHPTLGTARVLGYVPWERKQEFRRQIAVVMGQKSQLWPDLPASESLLMNKCIYDIDDASYRRVLGEFTEMLDVGHVMNVQVRRLSLGERMKLEIIAALLHHPRVIFLDEPTIGLDIRAQKSIRNFIREYNRAEKATILLTSHQMQDIEELCRRAVIISHGQLVYDGDLKEAGRFASGKKLMTLRLGREADPARLARWGNVRQDDGSAVVLEVDRSRVKEAAADLIAGLDILDFNIQDPPLEETLELLYSGKAVSDEE